jgi:plasmid stabilization system protein ParE
MSKQIIWSPLSVNDVEKVIEYLQQNWNEKVLSDFLNEIDFLLLQIATHPRQYPIVNKKFKVRKCVISKHNSLFYREKKSHIELLRIFDTRQHPQKIKFK